MSSQSTKAVGPIGAAALGHSSPTGATAADPLPPGQAAPGAGKSFYPALILWVAWMAFLLFMMFLRMRTSAS